MRKTENKFTTKELAVSAMVIAIYVVTMYCTQSFSFGQYQIRIATAMYSLAYFFPFLILPLGIANFTSNILGGMGPADMIGGFIVGILTSAAAAYIGKMKKSEVFVFLPIVFVPGLGVSLWLSEILGISYSALALSLCIGQIAPGIAGVVIVKVLRKFVTYI